MAIRPSSGPRRRSERFPIVVPGARFPCSSPTDRSRSLGNHHIGQLGQPEDIQDERHLTVSSDGRSRERGNALELFTQRLDHDFFCVVDVIDDRAKMAVVGLQNDDVDGMVFCHLVFDSGQEGDDLR